MEENQIAIPYEIEHINETVLHKILRKIKKCFKAIITRTIDILLSTIGVIFLIPITIFVAVQNSINKDFGPIFYVQKRIGKNGKLFKMYKFRTMTVNADEELDEILKNNKKLREEYAKFKKLKNDPRITKTGKFLRKTSLDEFPQFINVLKGDMTLVGPRPYMPEEMDDMGDYYNYIIQYKPGLTGIYQIAGKKDIDFLDRLDMDLRYHYRKNFFLDAKIAFITLLVTLKRKETYSFGKLVSDTLNYTSKQLTLFVKRLIDIVGAIVGLIILIPLTAVVAIVNFLNKEEGPLFYTQKRIGKDGKYFNMYKFRSMVVNADEILKKMLEEDEVIRKEFEETRKLKDDPRVTKIGKILRKTSLDEFPQFLNVLKGEMSLVGPRAVIDGEIELFGIHKDKILSVKPGITGYWAAHGRSNTTYQERVEMETFYANNMSIPLDVGILFKTVVSVVKKEGAV